MKKILSLTTFAFALYGSELFLALVLSQDWVSKATVLVSLADALKSIFPVIGNFDRIADYPEGLRVFLAITILLMPVKMLFLYKCFIAKESFYKNFIISPFSRDKGVKTSDFVHSRDVSKYKEQRSLLSVAFVSFMIVLFAFGALFECSMYGYEISEGKRTLVSIEAKYKAIAYGGLGAWLAWSCIQMTVYSTVATAAICVIRDWILFIFQKPRRD
ncbi:MAG: hypothetical protein LBE62_14295 [Azonexus sp.]|jgi:hypothetical protein|nr:hypothetical protein [Azonexus sp.]